MRPQWEKGMEQELNHNNKQARSLELNHRNQ
jgi:hypothetical protein